MQVAAKAANHPHAGISPDSHLESADDIPQFGVIFLDCVLNIERTPHGAQRITLMGNRCAKEALPVPRSLAPCPA